ncbi:MAG: phytanoyl-CoA dioxygenase family protein [Gammaproteobacteria bacterium]
MNEQALDPVPSFYLNEDNSVPTGAVEALNLNGVVCLRAAFVKTWLDLIEKGIEQALRGASADLDIVKRDSAATPWHQDHSYYPLDGIKAINCWVALDDIPLESALRFMQASHRSETLFRAVNFDDPERDYRYARRELSLPPSGDGESPAKILATAVSAGDMLTWKSYTLHSAPGNRLDRRRAAFSVNWLGDDIVYNDKPSLETYRDPSQTRGSPIICEKFPLLRTE